MADNLQGQLVFLGTGTSHGVPVIGCPCATCQSPNPKNSRMRCAVVLGLPEGNLLIDTPPELRVQLVREGIGLVHAVCYTHAHADHLFGLDDLRIIPRYLGREVPIYCEANVQRTIRRTFEYAFDPEVQQYPPGGVPKLAFHEIGTDPVEMLGTTVLPIRVDHGRSPALGFRVGDVAYCTDVKRLPPESLAKLQGLDTLILDCLRLEPHVTHLSVEEAIALAERLAPRRTLFTHMSHQLEHEQFLAFLPDSMCPAYDGQRIPLVGMRS